MHNSAYEHGDTIPTCGRHCSTQASYDVPSGTSSGMHVEITYVGKANNIIHVMTHARTTWSRNRPIDISLSSLPLLRRPPIRPMHKKACEDGDVIITCVSQCSTEASNDMTGGTSKRHTRSRSNQPRDGTQQLRTGASCYRPILWVEVVLDIIIPVVSYDEFRRMCASCFHAYVYLEFQSIMQ